MTKRVSIYFLSAILFSFAIPTLAQEETAPPLVRQLYDGNWPNDEEAQKLLDELFYQRAIHTYMTMQPALNVIGIRLSISEHRLFGESRLGYDGREYET